MADGPVIALIDGEHHPEVVRPMLDRVEAERGLAGVIFCGGEEKVRAGALENAPAHYGRAISSATSPEEALRGVAGDGACVAVVDLSDEPVLPSRERFELAALALHLGLAYEAPGMRLDPPRYAQVAFDGPTVAVIASGKRTGKTAVAGHLAGLLRDAGVEPVIVCMGRGGPAEPEPVNPALGLDELLALSAGGRHAASDHFEGAVVGRVRTVGCRRVGGGPVGEPAESNMAAGARLAAGLEPRALIYEGSGSCIPPLECDRTVCLVGGPLEGLDRYRLLRADLVLAMNDAPAPVGAIGCELRPEPVEPVPAGARVALFTTGAPACDGVEPVVASSALARRAELRRDLERAARERCDVYLTELKAAAIDAVAVQARERGARVIFVRNRPVGIGADVDGALMEMAAP